MYDNGFLSRGFTDWREILHGGSATSWTGLLLFWGNNPRHGQVLDTTGAIWWDKLLAEALVLYTVNQKKTPKCFCHILHKTPWILTKLSTHRDIVLNTFVIL